jgi:hypothetical protein
MVRALLSAGPPPPSDVTLRQAKLGQRPLPSGMPTGLPTPPPTGSQLLGAGASMTRSRVPAPGSSAGTPTLALRTPGQSGVTGGGLQMPRLTTPAGRMSGELLPPPARPAATSPPAVGFDTPRPKAAEQPTQAGESEPLISLTPAGQPVPVHRLTHGFQAVLPVPLLTGGVWPGGEPPAGADFAAVLFESAYGPGPLPVAASDPIRRPDGTWACRFPAKLTPATVRFKLMAVGEEWGGSLSQPDPCRFRLRLGLGKGRSSWLSRAETVGLEVELELPPPALANGDVLVTGRPFGPADEALVHKAAEGLPKILSDLRKQFQNLPDRRKAPRVPYTGPVVLYPVDEDGAVFPALTARCIDVSPTGLCCRPDVPLTSRYVYVEFPRVPRLAGMAVLVELLRRSKQPDGEPVAGMYRVDLDGPADEVRSNPDIRASCY